MKLFIKTEGERYEYETNMLIECKRYDIKIQEVNIQKIYINQNEIMFRGLTKSNKKLTIGSNMQNLKFEIM